MISAIIFSRVIGSTVDQHTGGSTSLWPCVALPRKSAQRIRCARRYTVGMQSDRFRFRGKHHGRFARGGVLALAAGEDQDFAVSGLNGEVRTWCLVEDQLKTFAQQVDVFRAHILGVSHIAMKGTRLGAVSLDGEFKIFSLTDPNAPPSKVESNPGECYAATFMSDAERAITVGSRGMLRVVDCVQGLVDDTTTVEPGTAGVDGEPPVSPLLTTVAVDGKDFRAAVGGSDGTLAVVDVAATKVISTDRIVHYDHIRCVKFVPNEQDVFVSAGDDRLTSFFDVRTGTSVAHYRSHSGHIMTLDLSPDGNYVVSGATDRSVRVWDRRMRDILYKSTEHEDIVTGVAFLAEGKRIVSVSCDGIIAVYSSSLGEVPL